MQVANFIMNLNDLYKPALKAEQQPFYQKYLSNFTENQLEELWQITMEKHVRNSPATIGELKKYSQGVTPIKVINHEDIERSNRNNLTNKEIFATDLGQLSLQQGWGDSYRTYCKESGIPEQTDMMIMEFQRGQQNAKTAYMKIKDDKDLFSKALKNLRHSMLRKNKELSENYAHLNNQNRIEA